VVFSSPVFLFVFLPVCLLLTAAAATVDRMLRSRLGDDTPAGAWLGRHPVANVALVVVSFLFYLYGTGPQTIVLLGSIVVGHLCGLLIGETPWRRTGLALSIITQTAILVWFKYTNFFVEQFNLILSSTGSTPIPWTAVALPAGVSFFVFHGISYSIDIYRRQAAALKSPLDVALYLTLFPQLIAGPIVRYHLLAPQLRDRAVVLDDIAGGAARFAHGLCKKVLIADAVAQVASAAFDLAPGELTASAAWIGALAYSFQIYFDFSSYSDMAIGLARIFGFHFPENFQRPYSAVSVTDFWRRWHMTLSFWFRDYVYKPLGGSRVASWRTGLNLWLVFLLSGLWHGATWTFVVWGAWHGLWLTIERVAHATGDTTPKRFVPLRRFSTFLIVVVGFTLFRAEGFAQAKNFYANMFAPARWSLPLDVELALTHRNVLVLALCALSVLLPPSLFVGPWLAADGNDRRRTFARVALLTAGIVVASAAISANNFSPFIYFRF
jgi:alginate O-acetyltransferase complex protein AlgI